MIRIGDSAGELRAAFGEQVGEDLRDAPPVGHHRGQVGRQVDLDRVPRAGGEEGRAGALDERGDVDGLRRDGQFAGLDATRVEKITDQRAHVVGLVGDDAVELPHLGGDRALPPPRAGLPPSP